MGPNCKYMNSCCENGYFNMTSMDICSFLGQASSGFEMYCSFCRISCCKFPVYTHTHTHTHQMAHL